MGSNLVSNNSAIGIGSGEKDLVWLMSKNCRGGGGGGHLYYHLFWEGPEVTVTPLGDVDVDSFHRWNLRRKSAAPVITFEILGRRAVLEKRCGRGVFLEGMLDALMAMARIAA